MTSIEHTGLHSGTTDASTVRALAHAAFEAVADQIDSVTAAAKLPTGTVVTIGGHEYKRTSASLAFPWQSPTNTELHSDERITHLITNGEASIEEQG